MDSTGSSSMPPADKYASLQKMCLACNKTFTGAITTCPDDGTQLVPFGGDENLGTMIMDKYKILELCGKGGMGKVYLAEDISKKNSFVAVKMLHAQLSEDKVSVKRFQQEASAAADLKHPNLIQQHDYGMVDGKQPFLVMEYLQGESLAELLRREGPLNPVRCLRIFSQVMDGLHYAHQKGVVHRDIKPSNILLLDDSNGGEEVVKVLDFGLAKLMPWSGKESQHLTKTGEVFGSPIYMSPEQCMGKPLEPSSDIYSLGITVFESLTGRPPFKGQNVVQTASKHLSDPPPTFESFCPELNLPLNLQSVVFKALEKEVSHRYHSMQQFKEDLNYAITGQGKASIHMLAAMSADATQPVKKADLDSLRSGSQSISTIRQSTATQAPAASKLPMGIIAAGVAVVAALGIGAFFLFSSSSSGLPQGCKGTVYFLKTKSANKKVLVTEVDIHPENAKSEDQLVHLTNTHNAKISAKALAVGLIWDVKYRGDLKGGDIVENVNPEVKVGENGSVIGANNLVTNYFDKLSMNDESGYNEAFDVFSSDFVAKKFPGASDAEARKKFAQSLSKTKFINFHNITDQSALNLAVPMTVLPNGEVEVPKEATRVIEGNDQRVVIRVDRRVFYEKGSGFDVFVIGKSKDRDDWKIDDLTLDVKADSSS